MKKLTLVGAFAFFLLSFGLTVDASCGSIIIPASEGDEELIEEITDCDNPFGVTGPGYPYTAVVHRELVIPNAVIPIPATGTIQYMASPNYPVFGFVNHFYLHTEDGYELIVTTNNGPQEPDIKPLLPGTYTLVSEETLIFLMQTDEGWLDKLKNTIIPTAHAFMPNPRYSITFTLVAEEIEEEPTGASSVLFLPGIMGSRLYETGDICGESGKVQLWPSSDECKQLRLKTNFLGQSLNNVYTRADQEAVIDEIYGFNLYKSFISDLEDWQNEGLIGDFSLVPYDWRLRLDDILKTKSTGDVVVYDTTINYTDSYLYQSLASLATTSSSKVTIVAHSNGGLVVKALLDYMEKNNDPLLTRINNLILIASPQSGTPDAVVGILHGSALARGWIASGSVTRALLQTGPFGHHLLPNESYFETTTAPIITFENGELTNDLINTYGSTITSRDMLHNFLQDTNRPKPNADDLSHPSVLDPFLLNYANTAHTIQQSWQAPSTMEVHQIVGTGLQTPMTLQYFTNYKCTKRSPLKLFRCAEQTPVLSYEILSDRVGDGTVVDWSARSHSSDVVFVDLQAYNDQALTVSRVHRDILEVPDVRTFISDTISGQLTPHTFLSETLPNTSASNFYVAHLHSPLDLSVFHQDGVVIGSSTPNYRGVTYTRYGEVQQVIIPDEEYNDIMFKLYGNEEGSFTFSLEKKKGTTKLERVEFIAMPSDSKTIATIQPATMLANTKMSMDYNGDGLIDFEVNYEDGELVYNEFIEEDLLIISPEIKKKSSASLVRPVPVGKVAGAMVSNGDEEYLRELHRLLTELQELLNALELIMKK